MALLCDPTVLGCVSSSAPAENQERYCANSPNVEQVELCIIEETLIRSELNWVVGEQQCRMRRAWKKAIVCFRVAGFSGG